MDATVHDGDIYCEDCASEGDSLYPDGGGEADGPQHCGSGTSCVNAEKLTWRGKRVGSCGAFLENPLTRDGVDYLCEMISRPGSSDYQKALHKLWIDYYRSNGYKREIAACVREQVRSHGRYK